VKVSICIPAYRQVEHLRETLVSIKAQMYTDYELIVTDDSPDDSVERLLAEFDWQERLTYRRNAPALGSPANWNAAVELSHGEYIKVLHHDDAFTSPDALEKFVGMLDEAPGAGFGFSASRIEDASSERFRINRASPEQLSQLRTMPECLFWGNFIGAPSATIIRRSAWQPYDRDLKWLVDIEHYIRLLKSGAGFVYCDAPLIVTPTNAAHQVTEACSGNGVVELDEYYRLFSRHHDALAARREAQALWEGLFLRYFILDPEDFSRYGLATPEPREYFSRIVPANRQFFRQLLNLAYRAVCTWPVIGAGVRRWREAYLRARGRIPQWR
jgi:glycosyltransferase involved in cell wall biosynthesis